jgi:hypothetical protein
MLCVSALLLIQALYSFFFVKMKLSKQDPWFEAFYSLITSYKLFIIYLLVIILWFFYAQVFALAPIILRNLGYQSLIWLIVACNAGTVVLLSVKVNKLLGELFSDYQNIIIALIFNAIGFSIMINSHTIGILLTGVIFLTIAELIFIPILQSIFGNLVPPEKRVAIFVVNAILVAIGEGIGFYYGVELGFTKNTYLTSIIYVLLVFGILISLKEHVKNK